MAKENPTPNSFEVIADRPRTKRVLIAGSKYKTYRDAVAGTYGKKPGEPGATVAFDMSGKTPRERDLFRTGISHGWRGTSQKVCFSAEPGHKYMLYAWLEDRKPDQGRQKKGGQHQPRTGTDG